MNTALTLTLGVAVTGALAGAPRQTFHLDVEAVRVDALVTEGNRPVTGLSTQDFELRDNGVLQKIDSVTFEDVPLRVMLVLDTSLSLKGEALAHLKEAASTVAQLLRPDDRSSLLTFSTVLALRTAWTSDHTRIARQIEGAEAGGATALHDAAYAALTARDAQSGRSLVLIFSDGVDTSSWVPGQSVIDMAGRNDAVVYAVGREATLIEPGYVVDFTSGLQIRPRSRDAPLMGTLFLDALTRETGGKHITTKNSSQLRETFVQIVNEFRSRYLLTYTPRGVESSGWHPIEVRVKGRSVEVTARRGYLR